MYTSSVTAGVNFSEDWYDTFVHVYCANTCDALAFVQGSFRVRRYSETEHLLFLEDKTSDLAMTPAQLVYNGDSSLYVAERSQQLLLWVRARKQALQQYRTEVVLHSYGELGFTMRYEDPRHQGKVTKRDHQYLTVDVTQDDVKAYDVLREDYRAIEQTPLTSE